MCYSLNFELPMLKFPVVGYKSTSLFLVTFISKYQYFVILTSALDENLSLGFTFIPSVLIFLHIFALICLLMKVLFLMTLRSFVLCLTVPL